MSPLASFYRWWIGTACLLWLAGCAMPSRAPVATGTPAVTGAPTANLPAPTLVTAVAQPGVTLVPGRLVAPVGNEVLLVSAVHQTGRPQAPYQRVEWLLSPNSVGTFLSVASSDKPYVVQLFGGANPRKLDNNYAVSETAAVARVLNRGTAITTDDVSILPGQAWLTLTSPVEGVSFVTAYAPEITGTLTNRQTAAIYWVDARWVLSPTQTAAVGGPAVVTATVFRQSTGQPVPNWRVRFTVGGGPPVNLSAAGAQSAEVTTNAQGQASVELTQVTPAAATNVLTVELIRPAEATPGAVEPLTVGTAQTQVVWTEGAISPPAQTPAVPVPPTTPPVTTPTVPPAVSPIRLTLVGPRSGPVNTPVRFQLDITNVGSTALENVALTNRLDPGWRHSTGLSTIKRTLPAIQAGQTVTVPIEILPTQAGRLCQSITAETASGQPATVRECFDALPAAGTGTVTPAPVNPGAPTNPNVNPANPNPQSGQSQSSIWPDARKYRITDRAQ
ncbi:MAG: hypothetical protein SFX18_12120 [Pirellulales bacterium]|nr:hypothetical protein [Pirellulales bacterium]